MNDTSRFRVPDHFEYNLICSRCGTLCGQTQGLGCDLDIDPHVHAGIACPKCGVSNTSFSKWTPECTKSDPINLMRNES